MDNELSNNIKQVAEQGKVTSPQTQATTSAPAEPAKSNKALVIILSIFLVLSLGAAAVFAYLYFGNNTQNTPTPAPEIAEPTEPEDISESNTVSIAQVESLLKDKYKFDTSTMVIFDGWHSYIKNLDQTNKILFAIYQAWNDGLPAGVQNISFNDLNKVYVYYFGNTEPLEKKDYKFDSVISKIVYRSEDDSFDVYFPDGIGGYSTTMMLSKVDNVVDTKEGFKATVLTAILDSVVRQDTKEFLGTGSFGDGKEYYEVPMTNDTLEEIRDSLSAYEFNFVNEDGDYKLVSIEKI